MSIVINSLYKTPEIFLRELISNGSDALDKIRFQSLTDPSALESNPNLNVTIVAHKEHRVITITDTGVGMTREELQKNLGTIAKVHVLSRPIPVYLMSLIRSITDSSLFYILSPVPQSSSRPCLATRLIWI